MKTIYHSADTRGYADHGWLQARHSFSFADHYDPERIHFGMLRVLNDDIIAAGKGFGTHPHNDMEIITIPLHGSLEHKDSMGNGSVITAGEVQVMSAGTGIMHSEFNPSAKVETKLFQIWVFPEKKGLSPRYDQKLFDQQSYKNTIIRLVDNEVLGESLFIHQKAAISLSKPGSGKTLTYKNQYPGNGVFVLLIEGLVTINGNTLNNRDALGVWEADGFDFTAKEDSFVLFIEVPIN